eukprot:TRINITY_DN5337_c0_g1_i1.p1 TRINITY_DN5337_c0_g1~~TRINITY_DN5337_c0_g1_i1.p1  ORF type:complete len:117 (-),score=16.86 TRINITY_DN5337_c0_g1_i1:71-421(-)
MSKLLVLCVLASLCLSAEAYSYGLTRYGPYGYPSSSSFVFNSLNWPGVKGPGFESTCWGCRGKRSADADSAAEPGYLGYGYGVSGLGYGYGQPRVSGYSYTQRSPQGLRGYRAYLG